MWVLKRQGRVGVGKSAMDEKECTERLGKHIFTMQTYANLCKLYFKIHLDHL